MDQEQWLVIVNPNAGHGKGKKDWAIIASLLEKAELKFSVHFTEAKGDAIKITMEAVATGFRKIITVGGDGTLNEVVNGVFLSGCCSSTDIVLGMIPVGTGNDWGRMFGIPPDYMKAVAIISENRIMTHDAGLVSYFDNTEPKKRYFINIAGLGFESEVVKRTNYQKDRGRGGKLIYFYNLLVSLVSYRNTPAELVIDGERIKTTVFSVNVGNGRYCGGGMRQTPDALPDDGLFDVTVINKIGKLEIIRNLHMLYDGTILSHPKIKGYKCRNLKVFPSHLLFTEADGEHLGHTPAEFSIIPASLRIIYGTAINQ